MSDQKKVIYSINDGDLDCDTRNIKVDDDFSSRRRFSSRQVTVGWMICFGFVVMFGLRLGMAYVNLKPDTMYFHDMPFFIGFLVGQILGAYAATKFPAQNIFRVAITASWLANLLLPPTFYLSRHFIDAFRGLQGSGEGAMFMAAFALWMYWTPTNRSTLVTVAVCGSYSAVLSAVLFKYALPVGDGGAFVDGFVGLHWCSTWLWFAVEKPVKPSEKRGLRYVDSIGYDKNDSEVMVENLPWKSLITSAPVWAVVFADFCKSCSFYIGMFYTAVYAFQRFYLYMEQSAVYGLLLTTMALLVFPITELCSTFVQKTTDRSTAKSRTRFASTAIAIEVTCVVLLFLSTSHVLSFFAMLLGTAVTGLAISGSHAGFVDFAGSYASTLLSLSNVVRVVAGISVPLLVITARQLTELDSWTLVFITSCMTNAIGVLFYLSFSSVEVQIWAKKDTFRRNLRTALAMERDGGIHRKSEFVL